MYPILWYYYLGYRHESQSFCRKNPLLLGNNIFFTPYLPRYIIKEAQVGGMKAQVCRRTPSEYFSRWAFSLYVKHLECGISCSIAESI